METEGSALYIYINTVIIAYLASISGDTRQLGRQETCSACWPLLIRIVIGEYETRLRHHKDGAHGQWN